MINGFFGKVILNYIGVIVMVCVNYESNELILLYVVGWYKLL